MPPYALREALPQEAHEALAAYAPLTRTLLWHRGVRTAEDAERYLNPRYERELHDPLLYLGMERAVERILRAVANNEHIALYADYDADGVPAAALMTQFFAQIGFSSFEVYIPDRHKEDYGLNNKALDELAQLGVTLVITFDCGITDVAEVEYARERGMEVIISDHHLVGEELPNAYAIIDAQQSGERYPFPSLCGAAVAFKLVQALIARGNFSITPGWEKWLLDLVAIATIADMVPLQGENRALAYYGLTVLRQARRVGLQALYKKLRINPVTLTEDDIAFMVAPRLNTASRMSHASQAYYLLTTNNVNEAERIAAHLEEKNLTRKSETERIVQDLTHHAARFADERVVVAQDPSWSLGVLGLAATRAVELFHTPVFLAGRSEGGEWKGSCRSDGVVNVVELMRVAGGDELFSNYGGHAAAGGFTVRTGSESRLAAQLASAYRQLAHTPQGVPPLLVDAELKAEELTPALMAEITRCAPFGVGNEKPLFRIPRAELLTVRSFGNGGLHLELTIRAGAERSIPAVGFFMNRNSDVVTRLSPGLTVDLLAHLEWNTFARTQSLRLRLVAVDALLY